MAKQPTAKVGTSRIRFIMLDAEIPEGDLSQITTAIQNALKPATTIVQQRLSSHPTVAALPNEASNADAEFDNETIESEQEVPVDVAPRQARDRRPRKPASMEVLDLDLTSAPSFESFASEHIPKNDTERNLVTLAWFKQHRPNEIVTANHVYTCYRAMRWPYGIDDFPATLRYLKHLQLVKNVGRGQYEINHLGLARVDKLGSAG